MEQQGHGLLPAVYDKWRRLQNNFDKETAPLARDADDFQQVVELPLGSIGDDAPDPVAQWRAAQKNFRKEALEHVHARDGCDKIHTVVLEAYLRLLGRVVYIGSREFEEDQHCNFLKTDT